MFMIENKGFSVLGFDLVRRAKCCFLGQSLNIIAFKHEKIIIISKMRKETKNKKFENATQ